MQPVERVRTAGRAFERLVAHLEQRREDGCDGFAIQHIQAPADAERLAERGREIYGRDPELISEIGPVIGTHTGPGVLGVTGLRTDLLACRRRLVLEGFARRGLESPPGGRPARSSTQAHRAADRAGGPGVLAADHHPDAVHHGRRSSIALYLVYLLRKPIGWVLIATFLAVALSGPVNVLNRYMRRGFAITIVYFCLLLIPIGIGALIIPPLVTQGNNLIQNLPEYAQDVQDYANKNERLRKIEADYNITEKLQQQAEKLPARIGDAASVLGRHRPRRRQLALRAVHDPRADGVPARQRRRRGSNRFLELRPPEHSARMRTALDHIGKAVGAYVGGVLAQATLAAVLAYIVLTILGVPFAAALAIVIFFSDLVPLVGATIGAVLVGIVTVFGDFPTATIVWVIYSIVYQQLENTLIQPQIQKRAVNVHPFIVLVAVLFGSTLLGVLGRAGRDPGRRVGADRDPRVVGLPPRPDGQRRSSRRQAVAAGRAAAGGPRG